MSPTNLCTSRTLVGTLIALITSTLDDSGLTPLLLTQKPIHPVYVYPKKDFYAFTFNPAYASLYRTMSKAFIWSSKLLLVITSTSSMYTLTMLKASNSSDIFAWKRLGLMQTPICSFWYSYLPQGSKILQSCLDPGDNLYDSIPYLNIEMTRI